MSPTDAGSRGSNGCTVDVRTEPSSSTVTSATWSAVTFAPSAAPLRATSPSSRAGRPPVDGTDASSSTSPRARRSLITCVTVAGDRPSDLAISTREVGPWVPSSPRMPDGTRSPRGTTLTSESPLLQH